jgi:hypothetical protein
MNHNGTPPEPSAEVTAIVEAGLPGPDNPVTVAAAFWTAVTEPDGPNLDVLSIIVTPESWAGWGNFGLAAGLLPGYGMASEATPSDDPDVVYVTYLREIGESPRAPSDMVLIGDVVIGTLVRRPRLGGWRLHALGDYVRPDHVPHDR